jgi:hypothetical protein
MPSLLSYIHSLFFSVLRYPPLSLSLLLHSLLTNSTGLSTTLEATSSEGTG